ncbi:hypothetical protein SCHPADRAFT_600580 [Schizopora paradoxa]|uniref:Uncharacterized protein n=1 Tax=Schizopora paradoxa TaxID=27342 RepID=A0A0H2R9Z4_9AGAM|nr:hypothetical protein SCHPADRAFT_600580 [Schizopora paradoxa]
MSPTGLGLFLNAQRRKSRLKKENIGATPARSRDTMDAMRQGSTNPGAKHSASHRKVTVARPPQERRAFKDIANVGWQPWASPREDGRAKITHRGPDVDVRPSTPTPAGSSSSTEISDLFSRLSLFKSAELKQANISPEPQENTTSNEITASSCDFCNNSQDSESSDQLCQCHRYSCVFDQSSGLLNDSQSTPVRDQDQDSQPEEPPWLTMNTQTQTQNACMMSMSTLHEALKSIVMSPCISEDEEADLSCSSFVRCSLLPPLARSISLGYIPRAFPQESIESLQVPIPHV